MNMQRKQMISKNVRRSRKIRYKRLRNLRKARDIASRDAVIIRRRKKEVWLLKDVVTYFWHKEAYLLVASLSEEIFNADGCWLCRPKPPSRAVLAKK